MSETTRPFPTYHFLFIPLSTIMGLVFLFMILVFSSSVACIQSGLPDSSPNLNETDCQTQNITENNTVHSELIFGTWEKQNLSNLVLHFRYDNHYFLWQDQEIIHSGGYWNILDYPNQETMLLFASNVQAVNQIPLSVCSSLNKLTLYGNHAQLSGSYIKVNPIPTKSIPSSHHGILSMEYPDNHQIGHVECIDLFAENPATVHYSDTHTYYVLLFSTPTDSIPHFQLELPTLEPGYYSTDINHKDYYLEYTDKNRIRYSTENIQSTSFVLLHEPTDETKTRTAEGELAAVLYDKSGTMTQYIIQARFVINQD